MQPVDHHQYNCDHRCLVNLVSSNKVIRYMFQQNVGHSRSGDSPLVARIFLRAPSAHERYWAGKPLDCACGEDRLAPRAP